MPEPTGFIITIGEKSLSGGQSAAFAVAGWNFVGEPGADDPPCRWRGIPLPSPHLVERHAFGLDRLHHRNRRCRRHATGSGADVVAMGGAGSVTLDWTAPSSSNYFATAIFRNSINNYGTATLVQTEPGAVGAADAWQDTGRPAGTYYYWLIAVNGSGIGAAEQATGSVTVT